MILSCNFADWHVSRQAPPMYKPERGSILDSSSFVLKSILGNKLKSLFLLFNLRGFHDLDYKKMKLRESFFLLCFQAVKSYKKVNFLKPRLSKEQNKNNSLS